MQIDCNYGRFEKQVNQNSFLNIYTFNIKKKLQMISFIEGSFDHGTNTEYRYMYYKREFISNYPSEHQMRHLRKNLQNKP